MKDNFMLNVVEEYTKDIALKRNDDDDEDSTDNAPRVSFGTFVLRVALPRDN